MIRWRDILSVEPHEGEEFRPVIGFREEFLFSNFNRLLDIRRDIILKPAIDRAGYIVYGTRLEGKSVKLYEHHLVWKYHNKVPIRKGKVIHHIDGNKINNDISNLEIIDKRKHISNHVKEYHESKNHMVFDYGFLRETFDELP